MRLPESSSIDGGTIEELRELLPGRVRCGVRLSEISRWKVGGLADCIVYPSGSPDVVAVVKYLRSKDIPYIAIGATSNLLFSDEGLRAVAICVGRDMAGIETHDARFKVGGGAWVPAFGRAVARAGYSGVEHVCGIPGTMAGLVYMNGGSLRKSISEFLTEVEAVDPQGNISIRCKGDCDFGYRKSGFQGSGHIITSASFIFEDKSCKSEVQRRMLKILSDRRAKFPQKMPNCGSVFKANAALYEEAGPPGAVLDRMGFKGRQVGGAMVSLEHANFINNVGGATAADIRGLAGSMRDAVYQGTGHLLEPEAYFVQPEGLITPLV